MTNGEVEHNVAVALSVKVKLLVYFVICVFHLSPLGMK